ncbi:putative transcription factor MYB-HB-like family [Helianthus annuus]|nr:putative transcription factor MYB-HB-like family [Helianthus annuus]KAJ0736737.1 putative transcription factor MYB-HB-like family [Helianthus annuus]KAJ0739673.1 putative transcription factor MYB-HB-like family [Helianthus annuus]
MEFFDEESRPRFLLQSRSPPKPNPQSESLDNLHKPTLFISLSLSALLLTLSLFYIKSDPFQSIFIWFSLSLLIGPFAPPSLTAGDIRVGLGPTLQPQTPVSQTLEPDPVKRSRIKHRKPDQEYIQIPSVVVENTQKAISEVVVVEEKDWTFEDLELLKKQMVKNPVGMPGRWEAVAEVFKGRHKVESVVKMAKSMGDRKVNDSDSFSKFLKDRKAVDKRVDEVIESERGDGSNVSNNVSNGGSWSSAEDIALLNALKAFPKDVAMRWEKITAAVPGRSKAACMKRVADLKKDFRSSKAASQA